MLTKTQQKALSKMTHTQRLEWWFINKKPEINPLESWQYLGIYRLSARIKEMREYCKIETHKKHCKNQFSESCNVANYVYAGVKG